MTARSFYAWSAALLLAALWQCVYFLQRGFCAVSWDESGRTLDAYHWLAHGVPEMPDWLPFYRVCVGLALKLHPDLYLTPRIVSCLFGLIAVAAAGWLTHELFQDRKATLVALALNAFLSQRVALSVAPLSEILFIAPNLIAIAALARYLRNGRRAALWTCVTAATISGTVRFEGWDFNLAILAALGICHFRNRMPGRREWVFCALAMFAYPMFWLATKTAEAAPVQSIIVYGQRLAIREIVIRNPMFEFLLANLVTLNAAGLISIFQVVRAGGWRQKAILAVSYVPLACASLGLLFLRGAQSSAPWRMSSVWTILLTPFTARLLTTNEWMIQQPTIRRTLQVCAAGVILAAFVADTLRIERASEWAFPRSERRAGSYLDRLISKAPQTHVLIESSLFFYLPIKVASQHPDALVDNSVPEQAIPPILAPGGSIRNVVQARQIDLFVFKTDEYKKFLDSSHEVVKLEQFGDWSIYRSAP